MCCGEQAAGGLANAAPCSQLVQARHQPNSPLLPHTPTRSLAHPNIIQGYKCCVARRIDEDSDAALPSPDSDAGDSSSGSSSCELPSGGALRRWHSGGRVVRHLTDSNCRVQVMEPDAVLGPGNYEL